MDRDQKFELVDNALFDETDTVKISRKKNCYYCRKFLIKIFAKIWFLVKRKKTNHE